jgi:uncharacterized protein
MDIGVEKYVSLTTFRRTGVAVPAPVWIAKLPDGKVGFTTDADAGKAKRIRNNPRVTLRPCDFRGNVADDAVEVTGTAELVTGAQHDLVFKAIVHKYWILGSFMGLWGAVTKPLIRLLKKRAHPDTAVVITLDSAP